jgi:hypothetical protein
MGEDCAPRGGEVSRQSDTDLADQPRPMGRPFFYQVDHVEAMKDR